MSNGTSTTTPAQSTDERWYVEAADPSVGIFGDLIIHECEQNACEDDAVEAEEARHGATPRENGTVDFWTTYRCPPCGAETTYVVASGPAEDFETGPGGDE